MHTSYVVSDTADAGYRAARQICLHLVEHGFPSRLVGGCVRDRILGLTPKDYDIATLARPAEIQSLFHRQKGYKAIDIGAAFGTIGVITNKGLCIETTTLRKDLYTDGRHAVVEFGHSFEEDAARRDFTINALSEDLDGHIFDYFDGQKHLTEKLLYFVGDPCQRIQEDYLRILRFFRFAARFGLNTVPQTWDAMTQHAHGLQRISKERITSEFLGLLALPPSLSAKLWETKVWQEILPVPAPTPSQAHHLDQAFTLLAPGHGTLPPAMIPSVRLALCLILCQPQGSHHLSHASHTPHASNTPRLPLTPPPLTRLTLSKKHTKALEYLRAIETDLTASLLTAPPNQVMAWMDANDAALTHAGLPPGQALIQCYLPLAYSLWTHDPRHLWLDSLGQRCQALNSRRLTPMPMNGHVLKQADPTLSSAALGRALAILKKAFRDNLWNTTPEGLQYWRTLDV